MKNLLRPNQVEEMKSDKVSLERDIQSGKLQNPGVAITRIKNINKQLHDLEPPDVTPERRDKLDKRRKELESEIVVGMPSSEEMRKNPPGVVPRHISWEKKNKPKIKEWKNIKLILEKGNPDPDLANIEQLRPTVSYLNMQGAQIPGKSFSFPSEEYKENYDQTFGEQTTEEAV